MPESPAYGSDVGQAILSIEGLLFLAHPQGVVGEVHSDVVAVGLDLLRSIEPPVVRDHVRQVCWAGPTPSVTPNGVTVCGQAAYRRPSPCETCFNAPNSCYFGPSPTARLEGDDQRLRPIEAQREARGAWDTAQSAIGPRLAEIHGYNEFGRRVTPSWRRRLLPRISAGFAPSLRAAASTADGPPRESGW